jgi:acyl-CoA hydrolase
MEAKRVSETRTRMSQVMTPNDANIHGNVFGGSLLAMVDLAAYTAAARFAGNVCVTASFDRVDFHEPIEIGEVVTMDSVVSFAGRTSIEVTVLVTAEDILTGKVRHTNTAHLTLVALKDGKPTPVPRLICETRQDKIRYLEGKLRRELRSADSDFDRMYNSFVSASDERIEELLELDRLT